MKSDEKVFRLHIIIGTRVHYIALPVGGCLKIEISFHFVILSAVKDLEYTS